MFIDVDSDDGHGISKKKVFNNWLKSFTFSWNPRRLAAFVRLMRIFRENSSHKFSISLMNFVSHVVLLFHIWWITMIVGGLPLLIALAICEEHYCVSDVKDLIPYALIFFIALSGGLIWKSRISDFFINPWIQADSDKSEPFEGM